MSDTAMSALDAQQLTTAMHALGYDQRHDAIVERAELLELLWRIEEVSPRVVHAILQRLETLKILARDAERCTSAAEAMGLSGVTLFAVDGLTVADSFDATFRIDPSVERLDANDRARIRRARGGSR